MSHVNDDILDLTLEEEEEFGFGAQLEEVFSPAGGEPMETLDSQLGGGGTSISHTGSGCCGGLFGAGDCQGVCLVLVILV